MPTFTVGDTAPALTGTTNADLTGATLAAHIRKPDGTVLTKTATATDAVNGAWSSAWAAGELDQHGRHMVELQVTFAGGLIQTFGPTYYYVQEQIA